MTTRRDLIEESHGRWTIRIHDDQPIAEGKTAAADSRVEIVHDDVVFKEFTYPSYRIWTLLVHWKDGLDPQGAPDAVERPDPTAALHELVEQAHMAYGDAIFASDERTVYPREAMRAALEAVGLPALLAASEAGKSLLALKDGPRDSAYFAAKDQAWADLRAALTSGSEQ